MKNILVIGAGTMGSGIAQVVAEAGFKVYLNDVKEEYIQSGLSKVSKNLDRVVSKGKMTAEDKAKVMENIEALNNLEEAPGIDLVIEAIIEDMDIKKQLYARLANVFGPETILASNTSALSITELASYTDRPDRFIGMHFFNPVPVMKLVELIKGLQTSQETLEMTKSFCEKVGKTFVQVNEAPGFVVNRMLVPLINEAVYILDEGIASAKDIDQAMQLGASHPIGPLALADLIGLDVCLAVMETLHEGFGDQKYRPCPLLHKMVKAGYLGRKTGKGFFEY